MITRLVIATHNAKKAGEMVTILTEACPKLQIQTLADFPGAPEPEETGTTYEENALIKALSGCAFTSFPCVADDAGLEIDALDGAPGVFSKRFAGEETSFPEKIARILDLMRDVPDEQRSARFQCYIAHAEPDQKPAIFSATFEGLITKEPRGEKGFGYDPIFFVPSEGKTNAELTPERKNEISHRGQVLRAYADFLRQR